MTASPPLVTIVVPAFNAERTLEETLRSAAAQTHDPLEIVIVDDGSTDRTGAIAASFCEGEPRARLIVQDNRGVAAARNAGIRAARGAYVAPLDADDIWHPTKIARQVAVALAAPEPPALVYCWFRTIDERSRVTGCGEPWRVRGHAFNRFVHRNVIENGSAPLFLRAAIEQAGGYDERLREGCEDLAIQLRIARRYPVDLVPEYLVGYRIGQQAMSSDAERMFRSFDAVFAGLEEQGGVEPRARRWSLAHQRGLLAERRAITGDLGGCVRLILSALRLDPARTGFYLAYRAARTLRRVVLGRVEGEAPRPFATWPVADAGPHDPIAIGWWARRLARWDHRRMERLADADGVRGDG